jgi:hypothetical protein
MIHSREAIAFIVADVEHLSPAIRLPGEHHFPIRGTLADSHDAAVLGEELDQRCLE